MSELPLGWTRRELRDVIVEGPSNGYSPKSDHDAAGTPTLKLSATTSGRFVLNESTTKRIHETIAPQSKFWLLPGDVVIQRANTLDYVGTTAIFDGPPNTYIYPDLMMRVRVGPTVDPKYLSSFLNAPATRAAVREKATGTAGNMPKINGETVRSIQIDLPPLPEQRRIVAKLEALQARSRRARAALDAVPSLLEKLRQSILAAAFRGDLTKDWRAKNKKVEPAEKLLARIRVERRKKWEEAELAKMTAKGKVPKDDGWKAKYKEPEPVDTAGLPELPVGWCWASVDTLLENADDLFDGPFGSALKTADYTSTGVRVVRLENVANLEFRGEKETFISSTKYQSLTRHSVRAGDIVFGSFVEETTRVCVLPELGGPAIAKADCFCVRPDQCLMSVALLASALGSQHARAELTRGIHGATRPRINTGQLRSLRIALPPKEEQGVVLRRIESSLAAVRKLELAQREWEAIGSSLDRALLAKAFRGELVPQDPDDEPGESLPAGPRSAHERVAKQDKKRPREKKA